MAGPAALASSIAFEPVAFDRRAEARAREALAGALTGDVLSFASAVAGCSPYLARLMERATEETARIFAETPAATLARAGEDAWLAADEADSSVQMKRLRMAKATAALGAALAEIAGALTTMEAAALYSQFADAAVGSATRMALHHLKRSGFAARDPSRPEIGSGLVVLAMGKHGAFELNYSSDVDLVVLFDSASEALGGPLESKRLAVAAARGIVARLNDQTPDGYVFRTDLRLRPDPGVSAAAVSINAAEAYYESFGQNWERAAFIKARAAAGDMPIGEEFIRRLRPFIWRKYLDFAAIDEIHAVMRQIHASRGAAAIEFFGHDLKRGLGGIREIEFFAQAQQLIGGGKNPALRARATLDALDALAAGDVIKRQTATALGECYCYLRKVEHRLQMIADEQTHRIPVQPDEAMRLACFLGEPAVQSLEKTLVGVLGNVHQLTRPLFEPGEVRAAPALSLTFSGVDYDPETVKALGDMGFNRPTQAIDTIRRWQAGETPATRTPRARALLGKVTPDLVAALARAAAPDESFAAFDSFLRGLPAGVQLFSMFVNRPDVFDNLIRIMTVSPFLGREAARRPYLIEALIESSWPDVALSRQDLARKLHVRLAAVEGFEATLSAVRRWKSEESFSTSAQLLVEAISPADAARRFTLIAETAIDALFSCAKAETARLHGVIDGAVSIVALGRLGARSMTAASDVDLMFVYEAPEGARSTKGLDAVTWYGRLVRRFLSAITALTEEGGLYEVDMALRPSGGKGPAAVSMTSFVRYYDEAAWTWEKMALLKARPIAGGAELAERVRQAIERIIRAPRDPAATAGDVEEMRQRVRSARRALSPWDIKNAVGGLVELDFAIAYLALVRAPVSSMPLSTESRALLDALVAQDALALSQSTCLADAIDRFEAVAQMSRAASGGVFAPGGAGEAVRRMMAGLFGARTLAEAEARLSALETSVRSVYEEIVLGALSGPRLSGPGTG
jgi:glutamate-ammonia-ligase adenylyltransferase